MFRPVSLLLATLVCAACADVRTPEPPTGGTAGAAASGTVGNTPTDRGPGLNGTGLESGAATGGTPYSVDGSGQPVEGSASGRTTSDTR